MSKSWHDWHDKWNDHAFKFEQKAEAEANGGDATSGDATSGAGGAGGDGGDGGAITIGDLEGVKKVMIVAPHGFNGGDGAEGGDSGDATSGDATANGGTAVAVNVGDDVNAFLDYWS